MKITEKETVFGPALKKSFFLVAMLLGGVRGKKKKTGIIDLSSIPTDYNVARTITFFSQFGKVGRVFLQPGEFNAIVGTIP